MQSQFPFDSKLIEAWVAARMEPQAVEEELKKSGFSKEAIAAYLKEYNKARYAGRSFKGMLYASIGALLGFVSCLLSIFNPFPAFYGVILFGLTSIAVLLVFLGLYFLFEYL